MNSEELRNLLREIVTMYFAGANVMWGSGNYSKVAKPIVTLSFRSTTKVTHPTKCVDKDEGVLDKYYPSQGIFEINLITQGRAKETREGFTKIYNNTAVADLEDFCNFIESEEVSYICDRENISLLQNGNVTDVTALLDGIDFEYRAMVEYTVDYMQEVSGGYNLSSQNDEVAEAFEPTPSGGRTEELVSSEIGYFTEVEIEQET